MAGRDDGSPMEVPFRRVLGRHQRLSEDSVKVVTTLVTFT